MLARLLATQLADPRGILGRAVARLMNRSNAIMNRRALALLGTRPGHRVLEIGFGGGLCLEPLLALVQGGDVVGIEPSATMVKSARHRFRGAIEAERLQLTLGTVDERPYPAHSFDRVLSVNTIYFWPSLERSLAEILRVLKPGGTLVLGYRPIDAMRRLPMTRHGFSLHTDEALLEALGHVGYEVIALEMGDDDSLGYACAVALCPPPEGRDGARQA